MITDVRIVIRYLWVLYNCILNSRFLILCVTKFDLGFSLWSHLQQQELKSRKKSKSPIPDSLQRTRLLRVLDYIVRCKFATSEFPTNPPHDSRLNFIFDLNRWSTWPRIYEFCRYHETLLNSLFLHTLFLGQIESHEVLVSPFSHYNIKIAMPPVSRWCDFNVP
jgi:hypothetical protein